MKTVFELFYWEWRLKFVTLALFWRLRRVTSKDYRCFKCWCWRKFRQWVARWHNKRRNPGRIKTAVFPRRGYAISTLCCETWVSTCIWKICLNNQHPSELIEWRRITLDMLFKLYGSSVEIYTNCYWKGSCNDHVHPHLRSLWDIWNAQNRLMKMTVGSIPLQIW